MAEFTIVFKDTHDHDRTVTRRVEAPSKSVALAQAHAIRAEEHIKADVIEAFEEDGHGS